MEKLARYIIISAAIVIGGAVCWYFRDVLKYILIAAVVSLVASPISKGLQRISIKKKHLPSWLTSIMSIATVMVFVLALFSFIIPIVASVIMDFDVSNLKTTGDILGLPLMEFNQQLIEKFPSLGDDFRIESMILGHLGNILNVSTFTNIFGSVTSILADIGIGIFSIVFISFFFVRDERLFSKIILSLVKDKYVSRTSAALDDIRNLLSRYFIGIFIEVLGVALINTMGLYFIVRFSFTMSVGIAFITGILNIIPYVGPLTGGIIGTFLGVILKFYSVHSMGIDLNFWPFILVLASIFIFTQLIDNFIYQPVIYSNSVKAYPLEIFIVLLMAGYVGGVFGMLVAIPSYTVIRAFAAQFLGHIKCVRLLTTRD